MIIVKRIYEKFYITDGEKILVERLWPRGIRKNTPNVDLWMQRVAPSDELRKWYMHDPKKWMSFKKKYNAELRSSKAALQLLEIARHTDPITLVYSASDVRHSSALVLKQFLERRLRSAHAK
jgi:uncharacterized protein YeaO (DUF488 family)